MYPSLSACISINAVTSFSDMAGAQTVIAMHTSKLSGETVYKDDPIWLDSPGNASHRVPYKDCACSPSW